MRDPVCNVPPFRRRQLARATSSKNVQIAQDERLQLVRETLQKVDTLIENRRNALPVTDPTWESRLEKSNRLIQYMAESESYQLGSDGAPIWPAPPIAGEDENLITSQATLHLALFPKVRFHSDHWKDCYAGKVEIFDDETENRFVPFGQNEDDELPIDTFDSQGVCPCGRIIPMMATCGFCLMLAE